MRATYGEGRRIAEAFFTPLNEGGDTLLCKCGKKRKKTGTSYANLLSHIRNIHPEHKEMMHPDGTFKQREIENYFQKTSVNPLYGWLDIVISTQLAFSINENSTFREHVKHDSISLSTLMRFLPRLTISVEQNCQD